MLDFAVPLLRVRPPGGLVGALAVRVPGNDPLARWKRPSNMIISIASGQYRKVV